MGFKSIAIKLPTDFTEDQLRNKIARELRIKDFSFQIENKSLDARKKPDIFFQVKVAVSSPELKGGEPEKKETLAIPYKKRKEQIVVTGSGPAGFFAAFVLQKAGFQVTLIERGSDVVKRAKSISTFEKTGIFDPQNNYAFGEGGAGTFSDGKLTSRSKHISKEKQFILDSYIHAGAPPKKLLTWHIRIWAPTIFGKLSRTCAFSLKDWAGKSFSKHCLKMLLLKIQKLPKFNFFRKFAGGGAFYCTGAFCL